MCKIKCHDCNGKGQIPVSDKVSIDVGNSSSRWTQTAELPGSVECPTCTGEGYLDNPEDENL